MGNPKSLSVNGKRWGVRQKLAMKDLVHHAEHKLYPEGNEEPLSDFKQESSNLIYGLEKSSWWP